MASPFVSGVSGSESRRGTLQGISVQTPLGNDAFVVTSFEYSEELGQLFELVVELESSTADIDPAALVGKQFTVSLELPNGGTRHFNAFMQRFTRASHGGPFTSYLAVGIPWFGMLEFAENCQIFENINCCELVEQVFGEFDFATYHLLSFCPKTRWEAHTQYRESTFNFMQRSLQEQGSYYFWTHDDGSHTLNLCDNISNHAAFPGYDQIPFRQNERGQQAGEHIHDWGYDAELQPTAVVLKDYNYDDPTMTLRQTESAQHPYGPSSLKLFDYPGLFQQSSDGERYARVRIESRECRQRVFHGKAQCLGLAAGCVFSLTDSPVAAENRQYLTTVMRLSAGRWGAEPAVQGGSAAFDQPNDGGWYACEFRAIPSDVQYRARFSARVPHVTGLQPAFVYAPDGQDPKVPYTDSLGRVQVTFPWGTGKTQTAWVRKTQMMAGNGWGHVHLPRPGDEVLVGFEHGNVDRPVVVGCLYNGNTKPPLPLPEAAHILVFKDQGGNLLTLNPQDDEQTITLSSPVAKTAMTLGAGTDNPS